MSNDIHAEARERYERAAAFIIRRGGVSRAELERAVLGSDARPVCFSPLLSSLFVQQGFAEEKRAAEERGRREWIEGVRRRLGLVTEVHRCQVIGYRWRRGWDWFCQRPGCAADGIYCPSQADAFTKALAHARAFVPEPLEEEPFTELQWALYVAFSEDAARQREADEAALGGRIAAVESQVNEALSEVLPPGMRFEWAPDGG